MSRILSYIDHSLIVGIWKEITSSEIGLEICVITAGIKKYKSINKKKKKKHDKIVFLSNSKLNSIEFLISKALVDSNISHDDFVVINNVMKEFMIWTKKSKTKSQIKSQTIYKTMLSYC